MACKLAVKRKANYREVVGDVISVHDIDEYTGRMVEPAGGAYVIVEVVDADKNNPALIDLSSEWMVSGDHHDTYNRKSHLTPSVEGDEFFNDLITTGRVSVTLQQVIDRVVNK